MNQKALVIFHKFVTDLTSLSKCQDKKVACIICSNDLQQIYSIGVNGGPKGIEGLECLCDSDLTKYSCIHAEANALTKLQVRVPNKVMICSMQPCLQCASLITNEPGGFEAVLFLHRCKDTRSIAVLNAAGIKTGYLKDDGEIYWWEWAGSLQHGCVTIANNSHL